jgi:tetratricopeptide (TPR) repeat protein
MVANTLTIAGQAALSRIALKRMTRAASTYVPDPSFQGWLSFAHANLALLCQDDPTDALKSAREAETFFSEAGDGLALATARYALASAFLALGAPELALRECMPTATDPPPPFVRTLLAAVRAVGQLELGRLDEVAEEEARGVVAELRLLQGETAEALRLGMKAVERRLLPSERAPGMEVAARAHLVLGNPAAALELCGKGLTLLEQGGVGPRQRAGLSLVHAEALMADGRKDEAREAIRRARSTAAHPRHRARRASGILSNGPSRSQPHPGAGPRVAR